MKVVKTRRLFTRFRSCFCHLNRCCHHIIAISAVFTSSFHTSYNKKRIHKKIQSIKVDLKQGKVREKVMQDFERYKTHFKSKIRIRMKKGTYTMTTEDGSMVTA